MRVALAAVRSRRRSQVVKAGVCKTPIIGSNPIVASTLFKSEIGCGRPGARALPFVEGETCRGGEIGKRSGLKIRRPVRDLWVQIPPPAPILNFVHDRTAKNRTTNMTNFAKLQTDATMGLLS